MVRMFLFDPSPPIINYTYTITAMTKEELLKLREDVQKLFGRIPAKAMHDVLSAIDTELMKISFDNEAKK